MTLNEPGTGGAPFPPASGGGGGYYPSGTSEEPLHVQAQLVNQTPPNGVPVTTPTEKERGLSAHALRLAVACMAVVVLGLAIVLVVIVFNASDVQRNADIIAQANADLRDELRCRAVPTLEYDRAFNELQVGIARALVLLTGPDAEFEALVETLPEAIDRTETSLNERERSLAACAIGG